ncbi:MAG: hypothetical protein P0S94_01610, partial [Simkaniaceae bacterium]|nr:hypothetical protein [Simkaniaceae bacterium]
MANNLEKPHRSLLFGTTAAILIGFGVYIGAAFFLDLHPFHLKHLNLYNPLVTAGLWGATLSGTLSNLLGAPRLIGALAEEKVLPSFFVGRKAILLTALIAFSGFFIGDLNRIALLLSMFFLVSYGMINFATGIEALIRNPSWRPLINTPWVISMAGGIMCAIVMLLIDPALTLIAIALVSIIFFIMKRRTAPLPGWEDMRHSILLFLSRYAVYNLANANTSPRNWRPNLLVFIGGQKERPHLTHLTTALTHKKGFLTYASIVKEDIETTQTTLLEYLANNNASSLITVKQSPEIYDGMCHLIENYGLGPITPNTIVLGVTKDPAKFTTYSRVINACYTQKKNIVLVQENGFERRMQTKNRLKKQKIIDVWWGGQSKENSELMILLAHMLSTSEQWRGACLTLKTAVTTETDIEALKKELSAFGEKGRFDIQTKIVPHEPGTDPFANTLYNSSKEADLVFLGLRAPDENFATYYATLLEKTENFPPLAFVLAGETLDFTQILSN